MLFSGACPSSEKNKRWSFRTTSYFCDTCSQMLSVPDDSLCAKCSYEKQVKCNLLL